MSILSRGIAEENLGNAEAIVIYSYMNTAEILDILLEYSLFIPQINPYGPRTIYIKYCASYIVNFLMICGIKMNIA